MHPMTHITTTSFLSTLVMYDGNAIQNSSVKTSHETNK